MGAKWQATYQNLIGVVWLASRTPNAANPADCFEVWQYSVTYKDGSGAKQNWCTSKRMAVSQASANMFGRNLRGDGRITFTRAD